jgi:phage tail-like protein
MATSGDRNDPYTVFSFVVEIPGVGDGGFSECTGLTMDNDVIEYRTGKDELRMKKLPGLRKFTNIVLKRGLTKDPGLYNWRKDVIEGKVKVFRKDGTVTLYGDERKPVLKWNFYSAWPSKLEGPALNAKNNEVAIETLELAVELVEFAEAKG